MPDLTPDQPRETEQARDHEAIYLSSRADERSPDGRTWCQDDNGPEEGEDRWTKYVRADLIDDLARKLEEAERERDEWAKVIIQVATDHPDFPWRDYDDGMAPEDAATWFKEDMQAAWDAHDAAVARATAAEARIAERDAEIAQLREGLAFYAKPPTKDEFGDPLPIPDFYSELNFGDRAAILPFSEGGERG